MSKATNGWLDALESSLTLNPSMKYIAVHGIDDSGRCTCGKPHSSPKDMGKHPVDAWKKTASSDFQVIRGWFDTNSHYNLGLACKESGVFALDKDPRSGGHKSIDRLDAASNYSLVSTVTAITGQYVVDGETLRGNHYIYKCDPSEELFGKLDAQGMKGIDVKHDGYIVISPSRHFSGVDYEWAEGKSLWEIEIAEAPEDLLAVLRKKPKAKVAPSKSVVPIGIDPLEWVDLVELADTAKKVDLTEAISKGLVEGERAVEVYRITCSLAHKFGTDDIAISVIKTFMSAWNAAKIVPPLEEEGQNSLFMHVRNAIQFVKENPLQGLPDSGIPGEEFLLTDTTDSAVVEWLGQFTEKEFCWNQSFKWMRYVDGVWVSRSDEHVREYLRTFLLDFWTRAQSSAMGLGASQSVKNMLSTSRLKNYEALLRGKLEVLSEEFNKHHDLLNAKNGVVDLRTGELKPHDPKDYFTAITSVPYYANATHPDCDKALEAIPDNARVYTQVYLGQACTGRVVSEDYLITMLGGGRNGKSTVVHPVRIALGGFATLVSDRILSARDGDHTTDLTDLMHKRFALLEEFPNSLLNVKRLKDIVGTPKMSARRMRENNVTWTPTHTMVITSNYEPMVPASDDATWRRLVKLDFPYRYVYSPLLPNDRPVELGLKERMTESPSGQHEAILAWLVQGAMKWYANGMKLDPIPKEIVESTREWRLSQDVIGSFLNENVELKPGTCIAFDDLFASFKAQHQDEVELASMKNFAGALRASEFWQKNGLKSGRKRIASIVLSRPNASMGHLPTQATCIFGASFKNE
jgi:putative DNA primase/helicase